MQWRHGCCAIRRSATQVLPMRVGPFAFRYQGNGANPANILIPLESQLIVLQLCRWEFLYNETLQHTYSPLLSKLAWTRRPACADRTARRQFQATGQIVSRTQASDAMMSPLRAMKRSVCNAGASNAGRSLCVQISRERSYPLPIYWYHSTGN